MKIIAKPFPFASFRNDVRLSTQLIKGTIRTTQFDDEIMQPDYHLYTHDTVTPTYHSLVTNTISDQDALDIIDNLKKNNLLNWIDPQTGMPSNQELAMHGLVYHDGEWHWNSGSLFQPKTSWENGRHFYQMERYRKPLVSERGGDQGKGESAPLAAQPLFIFGRSLRDYMRRRGHTDNEVDSVIDDNHAAHHADIRDRLDRDIAQQVLRDKKASGPNDPPMDPATIASMEDDAEEQWPSAMSTTYRRPAYFFTPEAHNELLSTYDRYGQPFSDQNPDKIAREVGGFLLGHMSLDPESGTPFVEISKVLFPEHGLRTSGSSKPYDKNTQRQVQEWLKANPGGFIVGSTHSHPPGNISHGSQSDVSNFSRRFVNPFAINIIGGQNTVLRPRDPEQKTKTQNDYVAGLDAALALREGGARTIEGGPSLQQEQDMIFDDARLRSPSGTGSAVIEPYGQSAQGVAKPNDFMGYSPGAMSAYGRGSSIAAVNGSRQYSPPGIPEDPSSRSSTAVRVFRAPLQSKFSSGPFAGQSSPKYSYESGDIPNPDDVNYEEPNYPKSPTFMSPTQGTVSYEFPSQLQVLRSGQSGKVTQAGGVTPIPLGVEMRGVPELFDPATDRQYGNYPDYGYVSPATALTENPRMVRGVARTNDYRDPIEITEGRHRGAGYTIRMKKWKQEQQELAAARLMRLIANPGAKPAQKVPSPMVAAKTATDPFPDSDLVGGPASEERIKVAQEMGKQAGLNYGTTTGAPHTRTVSVGSRRINRGDGGVVPRGPRRMGPGESADSVAARVAQVQALRAKPRGQTPEQQAILDRIQRIQQLNPEETYADRRISTTTKSLTPFPFAMWPLAKAIQPVQPIGPTTAAQNNVYRPPMETPRSVRPQRGTQPSRTHQVSDLEHEGRGALIDKRASMRRGSMKKSDWE